ncbi:MAG: hypothetical protein JXQ72_05935 [Anaerolineae bacterium]|nr:hypothetical protein [Anaerolineae bacterium]
MADKQQRWMVPLAVLGMMMLSSLACIAETRDVDGFNLRRVFDLAAGEQRTGDQVVMAYEINLETGSVVDGDVTLTGNQVDLSGTVDGDVVVIADRLTVSDDAYVSGDLVVCVKNLNLSAQATVGGEFKEECDSSSRVSVSKLIDSGWNSWREGWFFRVSSAVIGSFLFGALAALGTVVVPRPLVRMSETIRRSPLVTGGVGCLTMVVAVGLTVVYVISLLLILPAVLLPFVVLFWLLIALLSLLGWVALAEPFGIIVFRVLRVSEQPRMINAAIGGITLVLLLRIWSVFWFTAWVGVLATVVLGSVGLGAVLLTRAGTRSFARRRD